MPSSPSFPGASPSSSATSPLSYLIPARPPLPSLLTGQGYGVNNAVGGVPTNAAASAASSVAQPPLQPATGPGGRYAAGTGHPPLPRPPPRQCPRCGSANTKFCYYNNYSRSQPRYLCKACRRHWTEGGTLRDVPVGGGRKNRRGSKAKAAASSSSATATALPPLVGATDVAFPDILRQVLFQPAGAVGGAGYGIDMSAWQQMAAPPLPATGDANGALQFWSGWQHDDVPGLDGAC